ncbi:hypothetical protein WN59_04370 [Salinicoccus sediminis]|uniref:Uncharacterized protein n=1 Tax=Salinicoccus sediminis TaxID=1432562 RepID=A0A0M2SJP1_9STAP|nr:hypothetical protein [Salinicoccus sediminis]KKK34894.1 hypothetical protein WN59_04370 [Salinicoccus sediminis]
MSGKSGLATTDYSKEFGKWSLWYIPIFALVYIIMNVFIREPELNDMSFFAMALSANRIYMLVLGILAAYTFLEWSLNLGLTRKIFFRAMVAAGVIVTLFVTVVTAAISFVFGLMPWFGTGIPDVPGGTETIVHVGGYMLSTLLYFLGGFLISVGFYRGFVPGMSAVVLNVILFMATDVLWSRDEGAAGFPAIDSLDLMTGMSMWAVAAVTLAVLAVVCAALYYMIRNIPVKIK